MKLLVTVVWYLLLLLPFILIYLVYRAVPRAYRLIPGLILATGVLLILVYFSYPAVLSSLANDCEVTFGQGPPVGFAAQCRHVLQDLEVTDTGRTIGALVCSDSGRRKVYGRCQIADGKVRLTAYTRPTRNWLLFGARSGSDFFYKVSYRVPQPLSPDAQVTLTVDGEDVSK